MSNNSRASSSTPRGPWGAAPISPSPASALELSPSNNKSSKSAARRPAAPAAAAPDPRSPEVLRGVRSPGLIQPEQEDQGGLGRTVASWLGLIPPQDGTIHEAARQKDLNLMRALIRQDPAQAGLPGQQRFTPLMLSATVGNLEGIKFLMSEPKCNIHARDENRRTALHHLCLAGVDRALLAKELVEQGGQLSMDAQDTFGCTALHYAAQNGMVNVLKLILQYGGHPSLKDKDGLDACAYAARCAAAKGDVVADMRRALMEAQAKVRNEPGIWECVSQLCRGEVGEGEDDDNEGGLGNNHGPRENPVRGLMVRAGVSNEAAMERYMENLRKFGYDNLTAVKSIGSTDKLLQRYIPDVVDRKRFMDVLDNEWPTLPDAHLPTFYFIKALLSTNDDTAHTYSEALKKHANLHTGTQLMAADYDSQIEPAIRYAPTGHKKALRLVTQARMLGQSSVPGQGGQGR